MLSAPAGGESRGCAWGDFDNDGYLDLFVTNGGGQNGLFHNNGDGTFSRILSGAPVTDGKANTVFNICSWIDYDNDGFLDLFSSMSSGNSGFPVTPVLYHNETNTNSWLEVNCIGTVANRSAIGAKVRVQATIHGKSFWQLREISNGGGWNVVPLVAHFGLGDATNITTLRVEWPSGTVQELHNVSAKSILTITEPPRLHALARSSSGSFQIEHTGGLGMAYNLESSADLLHWTPWTALTNSSRTVTITDTNTGNVAQRFYRTLSR
jgi:hypothetical protein